MNSNLSLIENVELPNVVREYLNTLPAWDGVPRLDAWLSSLVLPVELPVPEKAGVPYLKALGVRWLSSRIEV